MYSIWNKKAVSRTSPVAALSLLPASQRKSSVYEAAESSVSSATNWEKKSEGGKSVLLLLLLLLLLVVADLLWSVGLAVGLRWFLVKARCALDSTYKSR